MESSWDRSCAGESEGGSGRGRGDENWRDEMGVRENGNADADVVQDYVDGGRVSEDGMVGRRDLPEQRASPWRIWMISASPIKRARAADSIPEPAKPLAHCGHYQHTYSSCPASFSRIDTCTVGPACHNPHTAKRRHGAIPILA